MIGERGDELHARGPGHLGFWEEGWEDEKVDGGVWMGFMLEPQAVAISEGFPSLLLTLL